MSEVSELPAVSPPLPWQYAAWERIGSQIEGGKLPHALLITAPGNAGKFRFAAALGRRLLCDRVNGGVNCGQCHACQLSAVGSHGDFRWVLPEGKSQTIKVDQVRDIVSFAGKTSSHGRAKVIVFSAADTMNTSAANALLKCLEEPPAETYLLLLSARPHQIPATLRSRCQLLRLASPSREESLNWLQRVTGSDSESEKWLDLADGAPLLAEQIFNAPDPEALVAARIACRGLLSGKLSLAQTLAMLETSELSEVLEQIASHLRTALRGASLGQLGAARGRAIFRLLDEVQQTQRAVLSGANPNRQLVCEVILEKLHFLLGAPGAGASIS